MSGEEKETTPKQYSRRPRRTTRSTPATESEEAAPALGITNSPGLIGRLAASALGLVVSPEGTNTRRPPPQDQDQDDGSIDTVSTPPTPPRNQADPEPPDDSDPSTASAPSDTYEDDDDDDEMSLVKGILLRMIKDGGNTIPPDPDPSRRDVQKYQQVIANTLAGVSCDRYDGGYSWLIERKATHKTRVGSLADIEDYSLPVYPARPDFHVYESATESIVLKRYEMANKFFLATLFWNHEILDALQQQFPGALLGLETTANVLASNLTAREAIEYILDTVKSTASTHSDYVALNKELMMLNFAPSPAGSEGYLKECSRIKKEVDDLEDASCKIPDEHIMALALSAFLNSSHTTQFVVAINKAYEATGRSTLTEFTKYYNKELRSLYDSGDTGDTQHGSAALLQEERLSELESNQSIFDANLQELHTGYSAVGGQSVPGGGGQSIPGTVLTDGTSTNTMQTQMNTMMAAMQTQMAMLTTLQEGRSPNTNGNGNGGGNRNNGGYGSRNRGKPWHRPR